MLPIAVSSTCWWVLFARDGTRQRGSCRALGLQDRRSLVLIEQIREQVGPDHAIHGLHQDHVVHGLHQGHRAARSFLFVAGTLAPSGCPSLSFQVRLHSIPGDAAAGVFKRVCRVLPLTDIVTPL